MNEAPRISSNRARLLISACALLVVIIILTILVSQTKDHTEATPQQVEGISDSFTEETSPASPTPGEGDWSRQEDDPLRRHPLVPPEVSSTGIWLSLLDRWTRERIESSELVFSIPAAYRRVENEWIGYLHRITDVQPPVEFSIACPGYQGRRVRVWSKEEGTFENPKHVVLTPLVKRSICVSDDTNKAIPGCKITLTPMFPQNADYPPLTTEKESGCANVALEIGEPGRQAYYLVDISHPEYGRRTWCVPLSKWVSAENHGFRLSEPGSILISVMPESERSSRMRVVGRGDGPFSRKTMLAEADYTNEPVRIGPLQPGTVRVEVSRKDQEAENRGVAFVEVSPGETSKVVVHLN